MGKNGLSPSFYQNFEAALTTHELLKLRFANMQDERKELSAEIVATTGAALVSMVGYTAIYYRPSPDPEKRKIVLPRRSNSAVDDLD